MNASQQASLGPLIVIPAFNEELALPAVLAALRAALPEWDVLVVDDCSTDSTATVAKAENVAVARLPTHLGIGAALRTGFEYAVRAGYECVVQFDADGQHEASEIPSLVQAINEGADLVVGTRFFPESSYKVGHFRRVAMRVLSYLLYLRTGRRFSDTSSGFRAFSSRAIRYFAASYPADFMESVESLLMALLSGLEAVEVPARMHDRSEGTSSQSRLKLIYHYVRVLVLIATLYSKGNRKHVLSP